MMGTKTPSRKEFYRFSLEERVPTDHLLRRVAAAVDFSFVRRLTARFYSRTGQPSVDPVVLFKMALVGYLYGITSERRLVQEIGLNLAYLWFIGYDLDEPVPDHSVLCKARARFGPTVYLGFFTEIVRQCERAGLVRGDTLYLDSTLVAADAALDSVGARALVSQLPGLRTHVEQLWRDNRAPTAARVRRASAAPAVPAPAPPAPGPSAPAGQPVVAAPTRPVPPVAPPAAGSADGAGPAASLHVAGPGDVPTRVVGSFNERMVSRVDAAAEVVTRARVVPDLYYKVHAGVDAGRARVVTVVEVTGGAVTDDQLLKRLVVEHEGAVGRRVGEVGADSRYGTVENYRWLGGRGVRASIPMADRGPGQGTLPVEAFAYDPPSDSFRCPAGRRLTRQGVLPTAAGLPITVYQARPRDCAGCPRKPECCPKVRARSISVADDGGVRDAARAHLATFRARQTMRRRKAWIETIFGDGKERRGLRRARCRGLDAMRVQAWMTALAQNVRQLALRTGTRPADGVGALEKAPNPPTPNVPRRRRPAASQHTRNLTARLSPNRVRQQSPYWA
jgi:transposase